MTGTDLIVTIATKGSGCHVTGVLIHNCDITFICDYDSTIFSKNKCWLLIVRRTLSHNLPTLYRSKCMNKIVVELQLGTPR
jgi:hypothetical protein